MWARFLWGGRMMLCAAALILHGEQASAQAPGTYDHYEIHDSDLPSWEEYAARRKAVLAAMETGTAMVVRSADVKNRSNDVDYQYRQRNSLLYLTGVTESESALLLIPSGITIDGVSTREVLFTAERNAASEVWTGILMGPATAAKVSRIAVTLPYQRLRPVLDSLLPSLSVLYYDGWRHEVELEPLVGEQIDWREHMIGLMRRIAPDLTVRPAGTILTGMRMIKSEAEVRLLQRAVDISIAAHRETIRSGRPGMAEFEFQAVMEYTFKRMGAEYPGYPSIVGSGPNTCILHYETNRRQSQPGDLVLMDCGAEYHGYSADITRTFPVDGTFTPEQRAIYDIVYEAQKAGIDACRAGADFREPHNVAVAIIAKGLMRLGIIGSSQEYRKYFMHGTSHYLGLDVHDVGTYGALTPGVVMTVEPGIYIAAGSKCDPKWWNIGIRIEDDILVTDGEPVNLSAALPRSAEEIERMMSEAP